jgi:hypothetical protein
MMTQAGAVWKGWPRRTRRSGQISISLLLDLPEPTVIAGAGGDSERVLFGYQGRDGVRRRREVEPRSLINVGRRWYLVAWDTGRP